MFFPCTGVRTRHQSYHLFILDFRLCEQMCCWNFKAVLLQPWLIAVCVWVPNPGALSFLPSLLRMLDGADASGSSRFLNKQTEAQPEPLSSSSTVSSQSVLLLLKSDIVSVCSIFSCLWEVICGALVSKQQICCRQIQIQLQQAQHQKVSKMWHCAARCVSSVKS